MQGPVNVRFMICNVCFFWSAVWTSGDISLRLRYCCNINPLAHGQTIITVQTKHALIAAGSVVFCLCFSLLLLNYICINKWHMARRSTFLQLAVTLLAMWSQQHLPPPACTVQLRLLLQFPTGPLHCLIVTEEACKPVPHIFMFVLTYSHR